MGKIAKGLGAVVGTVVGSTLLIVFVIALEAIIHLTLSFLFVKGADLVVGLFGAELVPDGKLVLIVGIGAVVSYVLARINKMAS